ARYFCPACTNIAFNSPNIINNRYADVKGNTTQTRILSIFLHFFYTLSFSAGRKQPLPKFSAL
ncbi:MAG TPA: hypothetical protein H9753_15845, partial [Candidatus Blautia merdavium]|nr:hypothetical protein [Candidatus Blautia merdavium]